MHATKVCECSRTDHQPRFVVLTGGPGAGKTAVLEVIRRAFCRHVAVLPEAAGIVFGGGFPRIDTEVGRRAAQRAIFAIQRELERLLSESHTAAVVLCDRGTLDGLAYWPSAAASFFEEMGVSRDSQFAKYASVIHLRTPPASLYNQDNPLRIESSERALEVDGRILSAWEGHPKRRLVASTVDFVEKIEKTVAAISDELPECCRKHPLGLAGEAPIRRC